MNNNEYHGDEPYLESIRRHRRDDYFYSAAYCDEPYEKYKEKERRKGGQNERNDNNRQGISAPRD